jgi:CheY-like chemotaxis protein
MDCPIVKADLLTGVHVLLAEDTPDSRDLFKRVLQYCGALVTAVETAHEAKQFLESVRPHVIVTDISMPGNGVNLVKFVQAFAAAHGSKIPVIAVTANSGHFRKRQDDTGFVTHLIKPVDPTELCAAVATAYARAER